MVLFCFVFPLKYLSHTILLSSLLRAGRQAGWRGPHGERSHGPHARARGLHARVQVREVADARQHQRLVAHVEGERRHHAVVDFAHLDRRAGAVVADLLVDSEHFLHVAVLFGGLQGAGVVLQGLSPGGQLLGLLHQLGLLLLHLRLHELFQVLLPLDQGLPQAVESGVQLLQQVLTLLVQRLDGRAQSDSLLLQGDALRLHLADGVVQHGRVLGEGLLQVHDQVTRVLLVVQHRAVPAHRPDARLAEEVERLQVVLGAEGDGVAVGVAHEVHQLHHAVVRGQLLDVLLRGHEAGPAGRAVDGDGRGHGPERRSQVLPLLGLGEEELGDADGAEGVVAGQQLRHAGRAEAVLADVAPEELLLEHLLVQHHAALA